MSGVRLIDVHLNGGTYNLGHRNPELVEAITTGMRSFDIGNHHFPSSARAALAQTLISSAPPNLTKVVYGSGGGEAIDIALKTARHATKRRKIVSIVKAYHGHTGLAVAAGDDRFSRLFLSDQPDEFLQVPFNDLGPMESALRAGDVAAVIMETIPATYGFPLPAPGYLEAVKALCERHGTLYIADEVQTGLMRTGEMWAITKHGIEPDILVTGKGLSGGMYPIAAVLVSERCAGWLTEDGFAHMSSFGGAELGCVAALKTLEICGRPETRSMVHYIADLIGRGPAGHPGRLPGLVHRHPAERRGHGPGVRPSGRGQVRDAAPLPDRSVGDLLDPGSPGAAVQAGPADDAGAVRGTAGAHRGRHRACLRGGAAEPSREPSVTAPGAASAPAARGTSARRSAAKDPVPAGPGQRVRGRPPGRRRGGRPSARSPRPTGRGRCWPGRTGRPARSPNYDRASVLRIAEAVAMAAHAQARRTPNGRSRKPGSAWPSTRPSRTRPAPSASSSATSTRTSSVPRVDAAAKIVVAAPAGRRRAGPDPVHQPGLQRVLQGHPGPADPERDRRQPAPDGPGLLRRRGPAAGRGRHPGGRPGRGDQVVEDVTVPLIETLMADPVTGVIVATGGTAVVRAAHRSGNPALGVGPGNVPVLVDATADLAAAAQRIADSKAFDNSVLCTNESVLIAEDAVAGRLLREMQRQQAVLLDAAGRDRLRDYLFPDGRLNGEAIGKDAAWIAGRAGRPGAAADPRAAGALRPGPARGAVRQREALPGPRRDRRRVGGPRDRGRPRRDPDRRRRATRPRSTARIRGPSSGFADRVPVLRVAVNAGNSTGSSGLETNLAPSMTLGTGFAGHSSIGENLEPRHLVNWTRVAYNSAGSVPFGDFAGITVGEPPDGPVPAYPLASNLPGANPARRGGAGRPETGGNADEPRRPGWLAPGAARGQRGPGRPGIRRRRGARPVRGPAARTAPTPSASSCGR